MTKKSEFSKHLKLPEFQAYYKKINKSRLNFSHKLKIIMIKNLMMNNMTKNISITMEIIKDKMTKGTDHRRENNSNEIREATEKEEEEVTIDLNAPIVRHSLQNMIDLDKKLIIIQTTDYTTKMILHSLSRLFKKSKDHSSSKFTYLQQVAMKRQLGRYLMDTQSSSYYKFLAHMKQ